MRPRIIWVGVVVVAWYGIVLLVLPESLCSGVPVMPMLVRGSIQAHRSEVCNQHTGLGDLGASLHLQRIESLRGLGNRYLVASLSSQGSVPAAVVAYPQHHYIYQHNIVYRLAFWNWCANRYPTFLLTCDGDFYNNTATGFDLKQPPTDAVLQELRQARDWSFERRLSLTPPCD